MGREAEVDVVFPRCAGLDVHRDTVAAAVRVQSGKGPAKVEVRTLTTTGGSLGLLAGWLARTRSRSWEWNQPGFTGNLAC